MVMVVVDDHGAPLIAASGGAISDVANFYTYFGNQLRSSVPF